MTVEETAQFMRKSVSWVYKNADALGGRKLGGSLFFPSKEDLYDSLFSKGKGLEVRFQIQEGAIQRSMVQDQVQSEASRSKKARGFKESKTSHAEANRHGLLGIHKPTT